MLKIFVSKNKGAYKPTGREARGYSLKGAQRFIKANATAGLKFKAVYVDGTVAARG